MEEKSLKQRLMIYIRTRSPSVKPSRNQFGELADMLTAGSLIQPQRPLFCCVCAAASCLGVRVQVAQQSLKIAQFITKHAINFQVQGLQRQQTMMTTT